MNGSLRAFTTNSSRQLNIFWHDRDALGVNRAQVGVFKQASQVRFGRFLQRQDSVRLESQVSLEVLGDFSDQALKRQLSDQEFGRFLVFSVFFFSLYEQDEKRTVRQSEEEEERGREEREQERRRRANWVTPRPQAPRFVFPIYVIRFVFPYMRLDRARMRLTFGQKKHSVAQKRTDLRDRGASTPRARAKTRIVFLEKNTAKIDQNWR
jgi:hypothetical protein